MSKTISRRDFSKAALLAVGAAGLTVPAAYADTIRLTDSAGKRKRIRRPI